MDSKTNQKKLNERRHSGHDKRRKAKRQLIFDAALELFKDKGFSEVSVREIASKAGVSPVTVFTYFGDKKELIRETIRSYLTEHGKAVLDLLGSSLPLQAKLLSLVEAKAALQKEFSGELMEELGQRDPEFAEEILSARAKGIRESMVPLLEEGKGSGAISKDLDTETLIVFFDVLGAGMAFSPGFAAFAAEETDGFKKIVEIALRSVSPR